MRLHDHQCLKCGKIKEFYGQPDSQCECGGVNWQLVFCSPPQIRTQHASVLPKLDEVNSKIREETMYESPDSSYEGDKW